MQTAWEQALITQAIRPYERKGNRFARPTTEVAWGLEKCVVCLTASWESIDKSTRAVKRRRQAERCICERFNSQPPCLSAEIMRLRLALDDDSIEKSTCWTNDGAKECGRHTESALLVEAPDFTPQPLSREERGAGKPVSRRSGYGLGRGKPAPTTSGGRVITCICCICRINRRAARAASGRG